MKRNKWLTSLIIATFFMTPVSTVLAEVVVQDENSEITPMTDDGNVNLDNEVIVDTNVDSEPEHPNSLVVDSDEILENEYTDAIPEINDSINTENVVTNNDEIFQNNPDAITYRTVTFESNGGPQLEPISMINNTYLNRYETPFMPKREGYNFKGWYLDAALTQSFDSPILMDNDLTLYAKWERYYLVTFVTGPGGSSWLPIKVIEGQYILEFPNQGRPYVPFLGWYSDAEMTQEFNENTPVMSDLTIYPKWDETAIPPTSNFNIDFNSNGGTQIESQIIAKNGKVTLPPVPLKVGYIFGGWFSDSNLTELYDFESLVTTDLVLYAKWDATTILPPATVVASDQVMTVGDVLTEDMILSWATISDTEGYQVDFEIVGRQDLIDPLTNKLLKSGTYTINYFLQNAKVRNAISVNTPATSIKLVVNEKDNISTVPPVQSEKPVEVVTMVKQSSLTPTTTRTEKKLPQTSESNNMFLLLIGLSLILCVCTIKKDDFVS